MARQGECLRWDVTRGPHAGLSGALCALQQTTVTHEMPATNAQETCEVLLTLGRHKNCVLRLRKDLEVSTMHAEVRRMPGSPELLVRDLGSTNGTRVNGSLLVPKQDYPLGAQDLVVVGKTAVRVVRDDDCMHGQPVVTMKEEPIAAENGKQDGADGQSFVSVSVAVAQDQSQLRAPEAAAAEAQVEPERPAHETLTSLGCTEIVTGEAATLEPQPRSEAQVSETKRATCMICHCWLGALDVLEQQLHINACLNGTALPLATSTDHQIAAPVQTRPPGKRKRAVNKTDTADEPMTLALALSKSIVEPEQQMEMELQQLTMELAQIDVQMQQLVKKRARIVKKMQKVSTETRKRSKSQVLAPEEARVLCQLDRVLRILFPTTSREQEDEIMRVPFKRKRRIDGSETEEQSVDGGVSMWARASQAMSKTQDDCELYVNSILKPFIQAQDRHEKQSSEQHNDVLEVLARPPPPDSVVRTFPDWRENLLFLESQNVESLQDALIELRRSRDVRHSTAANQQDETRENEDVVGLIGFTAADAALQQDQDGACAYFEQVMTELIEKRRLQDAITAVPTHSSEPVVIDVDDEEEGVGAFLPFQGDANESVISISDSIDCQENAHSVDVAEPDRPFSPEAVPIATAKSAEEVLEPALSNPSMYVHEHQSTGNNDSHQEQEQEPISIQEEATQESPDGLAVTDTAAKAPGISLAQCLSSPTDPIETQLLQALKAHSKLYEAVLLLQPVAVNEFFRYVTQDVGIVCTKAMLYHFFDRHGITFRIP